jgi:DNA-binding transcriptional ArsR family regulator
VSETPDPVRELDAHSLRGLAHPLRVQILGLLRLDGPSTATRLARRLSQDSGNISWHLRQLAEHGFIDEDTERGTRRERWWQARHQASRLDVASLPAGPEAGQLVTTYLGHILDQQFGRAAAFLADGGWAPEWRAAAEFSGWRLELTPAGLRALTEEVAGVVERHRAAAVPGTAAVHVQLPAFPRRREPDSEADSVPGQPAQRAGPAAEAVGPRQ